MKIKLFLLTLGILSLASVSHAANRALLVGIGNYDADATGWNPISGRNDVEFLEGRLASHDFSISKLVDEQATKENILAAISNLIDSSNEGDNIYLHFAGHGQLVADLSQDEKDGFDQSFVCYGACVSPDYYFDDAPYVGQNHLIDDEIFPYLSQLRSAVGPDGHIMVIYDSCYSEDAVRGELGGAPDPDSPVEMIDVTRGTGDEFPANDITREYLSSIQAPGQYAEAGGEMVVISACERNRKNYECRDKETGVSYGSLSYCIGMLFDDNVPMSEWADVFGTPRFRSYKIFRATQHPQVEKI